MSWAGIRTPLAGDNGSMNRCKNPLGNRSSRPMNGYLFIPRSTNMLPRRKDIALYLRFKHGSSTRPPTEAEGAGMFKLIEEA